MRRGPCRQAASDQMCYGWMESAEALPRWPGHTGRCSMDGRSVGRTWMETASRPQRRNRGQSSQSPSKGRRARVPTPTSQSQSSPVQSRSQSQGARTHASPPSHTPCHPVRLRPLLQSAVGVIKARVRDDADLYCWPPGAASCVCVCQQGWRGSVSRCSGGVGFVFFSS